MKYKGITTTQYERVYEAVKNGAYANMSEAVDYIEWLVEDLEISTNEAVEMVING